MITFSGSGNFETTTSWLKRMMSRQLYKNLDTYGRAGVAALSKATPKDSGETANSWGYRVINSRTNPGIEWFNTNTHDGANVAILIQYGHGTGTGGYVSGKDYINPAIRPIFDKIIADITKQVNA